MSIVLGILLGLGFVLCASPVLWPRERARARGNKPRHLRELLNAAGLPRFSERSVVFTSCILSLSAGASAIVLTRVPLVALLASLSGAVAPVLWLRARRVRVRTQRRALWPDVCDMLVASVRAGVALPEAVASLGESAPASLRPSFASYATDLAASGHFEVSIARLKTALADPVADRIIETLRVARSVGGTELTTVLRALSSSVRSDVAIRGEVESRQSWTRGAAVLGVIAPWAILLLLSLRPEGVEAYSSTEGGILIIVGAVVSALAYRLMMAFGRLPEPRRWFG